MKQVVISPFPFAELDKWKMNDKGCDFRFFWESNPDSHLCFQSGMERKIQEFGSLERTAPTDRSNKFRYYPVFKIRQIASSSSIITP